MPGTLQAHPCVELIMIKLGIVGAENSHSHRIGEICNVLKKVPMRVTHLWGETEAFAKASAEKGGIPTIVSDWRDMAGVIDGVMIDHRDGRHHFEVAKFFVERRIPVFVDKPLTTSLAEAKTLLTLAARKKTPICSFSAIPLQASFRKFIKELGNAGSIQCVNASGPVDLDSPYGGIFFYGIHQVDALVELMGTEAHTAFLQRNGKNGIATILFSEGRLATFNCLAQGGVFHWRASTEQGTFVLPNEYDANIYLGSARMILRFLREGSSPWSRQRLLAPIAILEALQASLVSGQPERVARF